MYLKNLHFLLFPQYGGRTFISYSKFEEGIACDSSEKGEIFNRGQVAA